MTTETNLFDTKFRWHLFIWDCIHSRPRSFYNMFKCSFDFRFCNLPSTFSKDCLRLSRVILRLKFHVPNTRKIGCLFEPKQVHRMVNPVFFGHRPIFLKWSKKLSQFGHNVRKVRLISNFTASFNTCTGQDKWSKYLSEKKTGCI